LPDDAAGWLVPEITDIPASRVQSVTIRHEGGDTIAIRKADAGDTNFTVDNIPEGRELSYPSVANSIASALDNLNLDDVRRAGAGAADSEGDVEPSRVTTVFRTFDGLEVTVESTGTEDETWIRLAAAAVPAGDAGTSGDAPGPDDGEETSDGGDGAGAGEAADEAPGNDAGEEETGDAEAAGDDAEAAESPDPAAEAESINARVSGWEYRIPRYKASQLRRGWDDLPAAVDDGGVLLRLADPLELFELEQSESGFLALWLRSHSVREFERGGLDAQAFAEGLVRELGLPMTARQFLERFRAWPQALFPGTRALLESIPPGIRRVLLSNTNALHWD